MRILVLEDEQMIAQRLIRMIKSILKQRIRSIRHLEDLYDGLAYVREHPIDLLFLDLNLNGADGFRVLTEAVSGSFQTIIVSAHADQAIRAFEYGVTDFVPKPFTEDRLRTALERVSLPDPLAREKIRYLAVRDGHDLHSLPISEVVYIKGADDYSEIHSKGSVYLHDKSLRDLEGKLPDLFQRIHRSYLVNMNFVCGLESQTGSRYRAILTGGERLPLSRKKLPLIRSLLQR